MISIQAAGVQLAKPFPTTDFGHADARIPLWPTAPTTATPRPMLRVEYAIQRPDGLWLRPLAEMITDPDSERPTVYHSRRAAEDARTDAVERVESDYGAINYRPMLLMRAVTVSGTGVEYEGPWLSAEDTDDDGAV